MPAPRELRRRAAATRTTTAPPTPPVAPVAAGLLAAQPCAYGLRAGFVCHTAASAPGSGNPCSANSTVTRSGSVDMTTPSPDSGWRTPRAGSPARRRRPRSPRPDRRPGAVPASQLSHCPHGSTTCSPK